MYNFTSKVQQSQSKYIPCMDIQKDFNIKIHFKEYGACKGIQCKTCPLCMITIGEHFCKRTYIAFLKRTYIALSIKIREN